MILLNVIGLGKAFRSYSSEWKRFARWFGFNTRPKNEQWILRDINFVVQKGEALGIVGENGAGKSTLLRLVTGTLQPTTGSVGVNGRIAAILELGMGFNEELTGRQNAFHAIGLMGFNAEEINGVMDKVEEFAEIGAYFDEPLRTYSSGMQMRVAFSVTMAFRPDILIVDEALSVGDAYFQHKSFSRIREYQKQGTTLLIVSHDKNAVQSICDRAILLNNGRVILDASPEEVFDYYNALIADKKNEEITVSKLDNGQMQVSSGTKEASIVSVNLFDSADVETDTVSVGEEIQLKVLVKVNQSIDSLVLGYGIKDRLGQVMYGTNTWHTGQVIRGPKENDLYSFTITFPASFGIGNYSVQLALVDQDTHLTANYEWRDLALIFNVINTNKHHFSGCAWHQPDIILEKISE